MVIFGVCQFQERHRICLLLIPLFEQTFPSTFVSPFPQDRCRGGGSDRARRPRGRAGPAPGEALRDAALQLLGPRGSTEEQRPAAVGLHWGSPGGGGDWKRLESGGPKR